MQNNPSLRKQRQDIEKQSRGFLAVTRFAIDHDSSAQTLGTLDDSRLSHAEHLRTDGRFNSYQQQQQPNQVLDNAFSSSREREGEIIRLQKKMCKLQYKIEKLQKRVAQLQDL